jgi:hypothetical protein
LEDVSLPKQRGVQNKNQKYIDDQVVLKSSDEKANQ